MLASALIISAGCRGGRGAYAGTWQPIAKNSTVEKPEVIKGNDLILESNGKFKLQGFPAMEGDWTVEKGQVVLKPNLIGGQPPKNIKTPEGVPSPTAPIILDVGKDRKSLTPAKNSESVVGFTWVAAED